MKKILSFLGILLMGLVFVNGVTDFNNVTMALAANPGGGGFVITPNFDLTTVIVTRNSGVTNGNRLQLKNGITGAVIMTNSSPTGDNFGLEGITLTKGTSYILTIDNSGSSYNRYFGAGTFPINRQNLNYSNGWHDGLNTTQSNGFNILSITSSSLSPESVITFNNPINNSFSNNVNFTLNVSLSRITNSTYILNGGSETTLGTNLDEVEIPLVGVAGLNNITVFTNTSGTLTDSGISFTVDTTNPSLSVGLPSEINSYDNFNFTQYINISDTNLDTCIVSINDESSTTCTESSYTFTVNGNKTINVTATDLAGNTNSSLNNIMLLNPNIGYSFNVSGSPITNFTFGGKADVAGIVDFDIYNDGLNLGSNTLLFEKLGFISQNFTFSLDTTTSQNFSFNVILASINAQIFDRDTESLILENVTLQLVGPVGTVTSTVTGIASLLALNGTPGDYQIIATTANYGTETVYFTYTNQQNLSVKIYMLNSSASNLGTLNVRVKDSLSFLVESAILNLLEWKPDQSSYLSVGQCQTSSNGICTLNIELNDKLYKVQATKDTVTKTTNAQIITATGETITITLEDVVLTETPDLANVLSNMSETIVGNLSTTRLEWIDTDGVVGQACITTYKNTGFNQVLLAQNCTSASTGILFVTNEINNTFGIIIKGTIDYSGTTYFIDQFSHDSLESIAVSFQNNGLDIFIPTIFLMMALAAGIFWGNIYISLSLAIILEWIATILAPGVMSTSIAIIVTIISVLIFWGISRK